MRDRGGETGDLQHLKRRDRLAFAFRIAVAPLGLLFVFGVFATSSWTRPWVIALFATIVVGGALAYHVPTSVVPCPACGGQIRNLRITSDDATIKVFTCGACGARAYLTEGFYWQSDISG